MDNNYDITSIIKTANKLADKNDCSLLQVIYLQDKKSQVGNENIGHGTHG